MKLTRREAIANGLMSVCAFEMLAGSRSVGQNINIGQGDEAAVRDYVANYDAAWNRHDGEALFGKRAEQIDRINAFGGWIKDPVADERVMKRLFAGPFDQSKHKLTVERIRFLTPTVALVVIHLVRIATGPNAGPAPALGSRALHVLVKSGDGWQLTGFANVPINLPPAAVREAEGSDVTYAAAIP